MYSIIPLNYPIVLSLLLVITVSFLLLTTLSCQFPWNEAAHIITCQCRRAVTK